MKKILKLLNWIFISRISLIKKSKLKASMFTFVQNSIIGKYCGIEKGVSIYNSEIGDYTYFNKFSRIENCKVGKFSSIGESVKIGGFYKHKQGISLHPSFHSKKPPINISFYLDRNFETTNKIIIGNDVFIGTGAYIMDGVEVGDGCIIGAKTIVTKSLEPYSIIVGNPGSIIRKRFNPEQIKKLLKVKWWNWDNKRLTKYGAELSNTNFEIFKND